MKPNIGELRKKYMDNPPEGMIPKDIRLMSEDELLRFFFLPQIAISYKARETRRYPNRYRLSK